MRWRLVLGLAAVVALGGLAAPGDGLAFVCTPKGLTSTCPYRTTPNAATVKGLLSGSGTDYSSPWSTLESTLNGKTSAPARAVRAGLFRARVASGSLPALRLMGQVALGATAFEIGWKIGRAVDTKWLGLSGDVGTTASQSGGGLEVVPIRWIYATAGDQIPGLSASFKFGVTGYHANWNESSGGPYVSSYLMGAPNGLVAAGFDGVGTWAPDENANGVTYTIPEDEMVGRLAPRLEPFTSQTFGPETDHSAGSPATITDGELELGRIEFESGDAEVASWVDSVLRPDVYSSPTTFEMPSPTPNETHSAYEARLRALGWLGSWDVTEESTALEGYGPLSPTRVFLSPGESYQRVYDPLAWPESGVQLDYDEDVTVRYNPDGVTPVGEQGSCPCPLHDIVWPSIDTNVCGTFPFGVACWLGDQLDILFGQSARAPHFTWNTPTIETPIGDLEIPTITYDLADYDWFDGYIAVVRLALAFLLWLGGLWYLGSRLLGLRGAPDTEGLGTS